MGRPQNPERAASLKRYLDADGNISTAELARLAGVQQSRIRKWKSLDKWDEQLKEKPRKRGGQPGNQNAAGRTPAKDNNKNAVTHGAFARVGYEDISPEDAQAIKSLGEGNGPGAMAQMTEELQRLMVRRTYLEGLLAEYTDPERQQAFYTDKIVHMIVPKSLEDMQAEQDSGQDTGQAADPEAVPEGQAGATAGRGQETFKTAMKSVIKSSPFERAMKVEAELNKLHGRIIKLLDSIKAYETEERRLKLAEKQYNLQKQKLTGEFDIDPETGEIEDTEDGEEKNE